MAALQHGLTFDDANDMRASRALNPPEGVPPVSAPHEHVAQPQIVHPPAPPSFSPPPVGPAMAESVDDSKPRLQWQDTSGESAKVTMHPSAAANLGTLPSIDETASTCGKGAQLLLSKINP